MLHFPKSKNVQIINVMLHFISSTRSLFDECSKQSLDKDSSLTILVSNPAQTELPFCQSCYPVLARECHLVMAYSTSHEVLFSRPTSYHDQQHPQHNCNRQKSEKYKNKYNTAGEFSYMIKLTCQDFSRKLLTKDKHLTQGQ